MSGNSRRACSMPTGSCARTLAPMSSSPVTSGMEGASRMSVGIGLEGEAEHGDGLAAQTAARRARDLARHRALAVVVDRQHRLDDPQVNVMIERDLDQRAGVLRKARAAEARPSMEEFRADPVVEPDAACDLLDVGADFFREIGNLG